MAGMYTSYDVVGVKEDISDIITNISPTQTPFLTSIGTEKVTQQLFQWQTDVLRGVQGVAVAEGSDPNGVGPGPSGSFITPTATSMLANRTQIFIEAVVVSGTLEATSLYGRARESAYQLAKSAAALKRDLEVAFVGTGQAQATTTAVSDGVGNTLPAVPGAVSAYGTGTTIRYMNGAQALIYQGGAATGSAMGGPCVWTLTGTGVSSALVESSTAAFTPQASHTNAYENAGLVQVLEQIYINGGNPSVILANPMNAMAIAGWANGVATSPQNRTRFLDNNDKGARKLINVIDIYVSPFGEQRVVNDRFLKYVGQVVTGGLGATSTTNNTIVYDPDMFSHMTLRPWTRETLAKTGDSLKMMIVGEFSLKCKAPLSAGVIVDDGGKASGSTLALGTF